MTRISNGVNKIMQVSGEMNRGFKGKKCLGKEVSVAVLISITDVSSAFTSWLTGAFDICPRDENFLK